MVQEPLSHLRDRSSIRKFEDKEVEKEKVEELIKCGQRAPTAGNVQPYSFIVVEDEEKRQKMYELSGEQQWVKDAPLHIFVCVDLRRDKKFHEYYGGEWADSEGFGRLILPMIDASLASQNITTAAEMMGLGSVMIGTPTEHPKKVEELLELPDLVYPLLLICIGYPDHKPEKTYRWDTDTVLHCDTYQDVTEEEIERYGRKIEDHRGMDVEEFIRRLEEHYDPEELKKSFKRMDEYYSDL